MKLKYLNRILSVFLAVGILFSAAPVSYAAEADEGKFCLVVEAGGSLVVAPEYVSWSGDKTVADALKASGHEFMGIDDGMIYIIDGKGSGRFNRSDQDGGYDLARPAAEISHYRFCESTDAAPSDALMELMNVMADYLLEPQDVQNYALQSYTKALNRFVNAGGNDSLAKELAADITDDIEAYKEELQGTKYKINFNGFTEKKYSGISIDLENKYGASWKDEDGDGIIPVPAGEYSFHVSWEGLHVQGELNVNGAMTVNASFSTDEWLVKESFALSEAYGEYDFASAVFECGQWDGRKLRVAVEDSFAGTVYSYIDYNQSFFGTSVPDISVIYTDTDGVHCEESMAFQSYQRGAEKALDYGAEGNTLIYRLSHKDSSGYTVSQDYEVKLERIPTLTDIYVYSVENGKEVAQAATKRFDPRGKSYIYNVLDTVDELIIKPTAREKDYTVTVNGTLAGADGVKVAVSGNTEIKVQLTYGEFSNEYVLSVLPGKGRSITFETSAKDVQLQVVNSDGLELPYTRMKDANDYYLYQYILVPGQTYSYVATRDTWYHLKGNFTLQSNSIASKKIDVPKENWLTELAMGSEQKKASKGSLAFNQSFSPETHSYSYTRADNQMNTYIWADSVDGTDISMVYDGISNWTMYNGKEHTEVIGPGLIEGTYMEYFLMADNPYGNSVTVRASKTVNGDLVYQDYRIDVDRSLTLKSLEASASGNTVQLVKPSGNLGFGRNVYNYTVKVPMAETRLILDVGNIVSEDSVCAHEKGSGTAYYAVVNGQNVSGQSAVEVPLSGTLDTESVEIVIKNDRVSGAGGLYTIEVQKAAPITVNLEIEPAAALLNVHEKTNRVWPENSQLLLSEGFEYEYTLTAYGYKGEAGLIELVRENGDLYLVNGEDKIPVEDDGNGSYSVLLSLQLEKAAVNPNIDGTIESQWADFRGTAYSKSGNGLVGNRDALTNNCVSDAGIPIKADDSTLYWASKLGDGFSEGAVGSPIIVDGDLITYSGMTLYRIDTVTGEVLDTGTMADRSSFSITPPTYYEGMIFVALADGRVQAFNADTLESLWLYTDSLGGQPNCPITVRNGYLYTGFWIGETDEARFVCIPVSDEDPSNTTENKYASWYYTHSGGFYWAGAYVGEDYVIVGGDDGQFGYTSNNGTLLLLDSRTGKLLDKLDTLAGDVRSTVVYDIDSGRYFFTSKGGVFYSVQLTTVDGQKKFSNLRYVELYNGHGGVPMSTSSPVVYKGRAYIGVSGIAQFSQYGGHNISVIDVNNMAVIYSVDTQGYPQTSGLLTTAYESVNGSVYVYFFDNYTPGKLRMLKDSPGQTAPEICVDENGNTVAYPVFSPSGAQRQYAICSPIVDDFGTVYFKNDSAHLMAFGSSITSLVITKQPDKTSYVAGEKFNPGGMEVTAEYSNGMFRDVTKYVVWADEALKAGEEILTVVFPHVMYHNQEDGNRMTAGVLSVEPTADIAITVSAPAQIIPGDADGNGTVNSDDAQLIIDSEAGIAVITNEAAADVSGDDKINSDDAVLILQFVNGDLTAFPSEQEE